VKLKFLVLTALLLLPVSFAQADEGHSHSNNLSEDIKMFMNDEQSVGGSHEGHSMTSEEEGNNSSTHDESSNGGGHGHGGEVIETPPNYKVLSVFGAINLSFIVIGLWNKRWRRKVELNVNGRE